MISCESTRIILNGDRPAYFTVNGNTATLNGVLGKTAYKRFQKMFTKYPEIDTIIFMNTPGSENDEYNIPTALLLKEKTLTTKATDSSEIASGAVDLFLAGKNRIVEKNAKFGVHSWCSRKAEGRYIPKDSEEHMLFLNYYKKIDIDSAFYWFTLEAAPSDSIHWMSWEEIIKYKITTQH